MAFRPCLSAGLVFSIILQPNIPLSIINIKPDSFFDMFSLQFKCIEVVLILICYVGLLGKLFGLYNCSSKALIIARVNAKNYDRKYLDKIRMLHGVRD